jgi:hypothetical protein
MTFGRLNSSIQKRPKEFIPISPLSEETNHTLRTYLRRLTNLSGNNRSLLLLRLHSEQLLDLQQLSFLNGETAFEIIKALVAGKAKKICPELNSRMETVNEASRKLKKLQRLDKFIFEEKGSNDLHVGWPIIRGKFSDGTLVRCPLLYFPVTLALENGQWVLSLRADAGVTFNKSFLLAYSFYNSVKLDDELLNTTFEDFDADSTVFRTQLYQLLKETVELNFNSDTFTDELAPFLEFKKDEFDQQHHNGEIKLFPEAVLGIFPQAGSQLVTDYQFLIESQSFDDLDDFFSNKIQGDAGQIGKWISSVKEEKIYTPFSLDAYQEHALRIIKDGKSLVVQGPPGTGKSQLIANLIADSIASRKKVLMVCQKRVALDVVYDRLKKVDLADFIGLVHDFRNDRKAIYEKIDRQIERIDEFKARDRSIDIIQLERKFLHTCRTIDQLTETLEEFRFALFDESEFGISAKQLYLTSNPKGESINIRQEYQYFHASSLEDYSSKIKRYSQYAALLEKQEHPWLNRRSFSNFKVSDLREIRKIVQAIPAFQKQVQHELSKIISGTLNLEECEALLQRKAEMFEMVELLNNDTVFNYFRAMAGEKDDETSLLWLQNMERVCLNCFDGAGIEQTMVSNQLGDVQLALHKRVESRKGLIKRIRWEMSDHKFLLKRVLIGNNLKFNKEGLTTLEQRIDNRLNLEHQLTALREKKWLLDFPKPDYDKLKGWLQEQTRALKGKNIFSSLREIREAIGVQKISREQFLKSINAIIEIISNVPVHRIEWLSYLTPYQVQQLIMKPELEADMVQSLEKDFDKLIDFDKLKESLVSHERDILVRLFDQIGVWEGKSLEALFQNSIRLAWLEHIETKYPVLRSVSTFKMDEMQTELQQAMQEKQKLSTEILLLRARERVYENLEYNRLNNRVSYRDLHHQVTKKKKIWPVRKVVADFSEELFNLMPCWMASPESVSAIFPMMPLFDIVIFDEASQCFSERGIPAMYRGKQILIAGDSKQLKPFELYQARWEAETENPDLEVDSLLELSERYLPTVQLRGHYRSQSLALINFSNQYFYGGNLKLLPDRRMVNNQQPPIEFHKVTGLWENQTNVPEAQEVVSRAFELITRHPEKEIGIITFNAPQQLLLMDLMEEASVKAGVKIPEMLFIKNIENVQGDERDIIIFSIGYAPDEDGKLNMQFGSLNMAGGENRLNVAVTRAREKIIIVSSIVPEELKLQGIKNEGPKLLKKYLEFARQVSEGNFRFKELIGEQHALDWYLSKHILDVNKNNTTVSFSAHTLPFTDVVIHQGENQLGVLLTDDQLYYTSATIKESHFYTPTLLQQKNWKYHRIFSRSWWMDREAVENELTKYIYHVSTDK